MAANQTEECIPAQTPRSRVREKLLEAKHQDREYSARAFEDNPQTLTQPKDTSGSSTLGAGDFTPDDLEALKVSATTPHAIVCLFSFSSCTRLFPFLR